MTKEELKPILADVFKVARFLTGLTRKTSIDDVVVATIEGVVMQEWALELILKLVNGQVTGDQLRDCTNILSDIA